MLYLVRKEGESVIINDTIEVKVIEVKGKSAKIGFEFPESASVLRKEIHDRVVAENVAASQGSNTLEAEALAGLDFSKLTLSKPKTPTDDKNPTDKDA